MLIRMLLVAGLVAMGTTRASAQYRTSQGAGLGGLAGAVIGGVIGHQNDELAEGALIGGAVGAVTGGVIGHARDQNEAAAWHHYHWQQQQRSIRYQRAVSTSDVVAMSRNGLSDAVICNHIYANGVQRRLEVQDVISLHQQGVSDTVLSAMQQAVVAPGCVPAYSSGPVLVEQHFHPPAHYHGSHGYHYRAYAPPGGYWR